MVSAARLFLAPVSVCLAVLAGCSSGSSSSSSGGGGTTTPTPTTATLAAGGASQVYVVQQSSNTSGSILQFSATASGSATPAATIGQIANYAQSVALDASGNIYVGSGTLGSLTGAQIQVYPAGATSATAAIRTITGTSANPLGLPEALTVDSSGQVYALTNVGANIAVYVYAANATGPVDPIKVITGSQTLLTLITPLDIAVDSAKNIYVAFATPGNTGEVAVFSAAANGNVAPARTLTNSNLFFGIAVDSSMNLWAAMNSVGGSSASASIAEYSASATGAATPTKTISGSATGFASAYISALRLDSASNVWVSYDTPIVSGNGRSNSNVAAFGPTGTGNMAPGATFNSTAWTAGGTEIAVK